MSFGLFRRIFYPGFMIGIVLYLTLDVIQEMKQIQSVVGFVFFILFVYLSSVNPNKVRI